MGGVYQFCGLIVGSMSNEERETTIRWPEGSLVRNTSNMPTRPPGPIARYYQRLLPAEQAQFERNLKVLRKSAPVNDEEAEGIDRFESTRIGGLTPEEAHYVADLLQRMSPCEAIHHLYYEDHPYRSANVPNVNIKRTAWNSVRNRPLNNLKPSKKQRARGLGLKPLRQRQNIPLGNLEGYTEEMRMIRHIASQYDLDPEICLEGYATAYNRPNNLPQNVAFGYMDDFLRLGSRGGAKNEQKNGSKKNNNTRRLRFNPMVGVKNTNLNSAKKYRGLTNNSKNTRGRSRRAPKGVYYGQESRSPIAINNRNIRNFTQKNREARSLGKMTPHNSYYTAKTLEGRTPCEAIQDLLEKQERYRIVGARHLVESAERSIKKIKAQFGVRAADCASGINMYANHNNASSVNAEYYNEAIPRNGRPDFSGMYIRGSLNNNNNNTSSTRAANGNGNNE